MRIDGHTRLAGVIAKPIKHSISPFIHNMAYHLTDTNAVYLALEVDPKDLGKAVENIKLYHMLGANVSMPYKSEVIQFLDELDETAREIGAVNTIINRHGCLIGYNTDGVGFFQSLPDFNLKGKNLTILGAGGATSAIISQAVKEGVKRVFVFSRSKNLSKTEDRLTQLSKRLSHAIVVQAIEDLSALDTAVGQSALLVNATGVGMDGKSLPIPNSFIFPKHILVADIAYSPMKTPFLQMASKQGISTVNGLGMLLYQAERAFELMTGKAMPTEPIKNALLKHFAE